jgi:diguanylate cyclase (GGDEF)-like protein
LTLNLDDDSDAIIDNLSGAALERAIANSDRAAAARDRLAAAKDREAAAADRRRAAEFLHASYRDELSGALTRRAGREQLLAEVHRAGRRDEPLPLVFIDVDHLKWTNDNLGHDVGDRLIAATGAALRESMRDYDVVVRHGGDEFVCALPGAADGVAAAAAARARQLLQEAVNGATFSAGHALLRPGESLDDVIRRADVDLYRRREQVRRDLAAGGITVLSDRPRANSVGLVPTVECAACGSGIPLREFGKVGSAAAGRMAACPRCGARTEIRLANGPVDDLGLRGARADGPRGDR